MEDRNMNDQKTLADGSDGDSGGGWIIWAACGSLVLASVIVGGLFLCGAPGFTSLQTATALTTTPGGIHSVPLTIVTNAGPQRDWPAFEPSSFSIPAAQLVTITVTNLDSATPLPAALGSHAKVTGVVGGAVTVTPIHEARPYKAEGKSHRVSAINLNRVSHTFSIPSLGVNVPIAANSRTSFTILIAKPGNYSWLCFDPCGAGTSGIGAPMGLSGYMAGIVTAAAG
jgi:hypothetical protein